MDLEVIQSDETESQISLTITNAIPPLEIKWYENQNIKPQLYILRLLLELMSKLQRLQLIVGLKLWLSEEMQLLLVYQLVYIEQLQQMEEFHPAMVMNSLPEILLFQKAHYPFLIFEQQKIFLKFLLDHVRTIQNPPVQ